MMRTSLVPQLLTAPTAYPVSLAEVRSQLSIDTQDYDPRLAALIGAATGQVEAYLGMALVTRSYHGFLDRWPQCRDTWSTGHGSRFTRGPWRREIEIPMPPLIGVDFVKTYDDTDVVTVFDPSNYYVDTASLVGRLVLRKSAEWPAPARAANGIEIGWTCGVGTTLRPFLDDDIRAAIVMTVGMLNEQRGDDPTPIELSAGAKALLNAHRVDWL